MSYARNFLRIYVWQGMSIGVGFLSLFLVTPALSSNKVIYGIYSLCISLTIFLSYGDLGFLGAGFKFASEAVAQGNRREEIRIIGFVSLIFGVFGVLYACTILGLSFVPRVVFANLGGKDAATTAARLLLVLALSSLNVLYQRILQVVFGIRLEDFRLRRLSVVGTLIGISSVFWFFRSGSRDIVGYYVTVQSAGVVVSVVASLIARKRYGYRLRDVVPTIRLDKEVYRKTKRLAFTTLFATLGWLVYYELDMLFISSHIGVTSLAYYSIAFALINFLRSLLGTLFSPFQARFNHFIGLSDLSGLRVYYQKVLGLTAPPVIFVVLTVFLLMKPFIVSWVGPGYRPSIVIGQLLIWIYFLSYFQYPAGVLLVAQQRVKEINFITLFNVVVFWAGVLVSYRVLGVVSIALFKLATFVLAGAYYAYVSVRFVGDPMRTLSRLYLPLLVPSGFLVVLLLLVRGLFPLVKDRGVMAEVILTGAVCAGATFGTYLVLNRRYRSLVVEIARQARGAKRAD